MSRKKKKPATRQPRRTTRGAHAIPDQREPSPEELEALQQLRMAIRSDAPVDLLMIVSALLAVMDPPGSDPFGDDEPPLTLEQLVGSFVGADFAETTAALMVLRALVPDELLAARIGKVLESRRQPMPEWLRQLDAPAVSRVVKLADVLGDGDDYFLEARLPTGEMLTAVVYIDHNLGGPVEDGFVLAETYEVVRQHVHEQPGESDAVFVDVDPAQARATIEAAIRLGAMMFPPLESEDWPLCRPLVEWLLRSLPAGGQAPERVEWSDHDHAVLHREFLASPFGLGLDQSDERELLNEITWFGNGWAGGDPLRWSPPRVQVFMTDWFPRKVAGEAAYLSKAPDLLRAFVRYCHERREIPPELTAETIQAVDECEPEFQRLIRSSRSMGAQALVETFLEEGLLGGRSGGIVGHYERAAGGHDALLALDAEPLPDEDFDWSGIPADIRQRVAEVLALCDRCADELFDVEHRTALRRFLGRAAVGDPAIFRRKGSTDRAAAAVCWAVAKANHSIMYGPDALASRDLLAWFGVHGSVSQRAEPFIQAVGADRYQIRELALGSPDFLVAKRRAEMIDYRDRYLTETAGTGS